MGENIQNKITQISTNYKAVIGNYIKHKINIMKVGLQDYGTELCFVTYRKKGYVPIHAPVTA